MPNLIACLRAAGLRIRPAEAREQSTRNWRWKLLAPIRRFRPLTDLPLARLLGKRFYVPGQPQPNSKTAAVVNELRDAGIDHLLLVHGTSQDEAMLVKAARLIFRLPWALGFLVQTHKRCRYLDRVERQTLLNYALARRWLRNRPGLMPVIISDVSPGRHALWCAAAAEGNRAIWWQDDFHHHRPLPYAIRGAAVLNEPGLAVARDKGSARVIAKRPTKPPLPIRPIPESPVVGMATNASFSVGPNEIAMMNALVKALNVPVLHLRVHPTRPLTNDDVKGAPVQLAPREESMEEFAARIDLAIVGNSAAQLWLIRNGVPVIHVPGFDMQGYDRYGYAERGFVYGSEYIDQISIADIVDFYKGVDAILAKVTEYTTVRYDQCAGVLEDLKTLCKCIRGVDYDADTRDNDYHE